MTALPPEVRAVVEAARGVVPHVTLCAEGSPMWRLIEALAALDAAPAPDEEALVKRVRAAIHLEAVSIMIDKWPAGLAWREVATRIARHGARAAIEAMRGQAQ